MFTVARVLILKSFQLFPMCDSNYAQDRESTGKNLNMFYYNPLVLRAFDTLLHDDGVIFENANVWYPVTGVNLMGANEALRSYGVSISEEPFELKLKKNSLVNVSMLIIGKEVNEYWARL